MAPLDLGFIRAVKNDANSLAELVTLYQPWKQKSPSLPKGFFGVLVVISSQDGWFKFPWPRDFSQPWCYRNQVECASEDGVVFGGGFLVYLG